MMNVLLYGNGSTLNRGCEAIVRGSEIFFRQALGDVRFDFASFAPPDDTEVLAGSSYYELPLHIKRFGRYWWFRQLCRILPVPARYTAPPIMKRDLKDYVKQVDLAVSVGGDNYAIEYGDEIVNRLLGIGRFFRNSNVPVVVWGASIGPFDTDKNIERMIVREMSQYALIVVREKESQKYLENLGLTDNVRFAPDPAFLLPLQEPQLSPHTRAFISGHDSIVGMNFSPLMARFTSEDNMVKWTETVAETVRIIVNSCGAKVLLIPHVFSNNNNPLVDDLLFLDQVLKKLDSSTNEKVSLIDQQFSAAELKWIISQMNLFVGARTHSTIAAFSSAVPCISLAYSRKALGLNQLMYGHLDWVLQKGNISPEMIGSKVRELLECKNNVRTMLRKKSDLLCDQFSQLESDIKSIVKRPVC